MRLPWLIKYGLREELIVILTGVILGIGSGLLWPGAMPWPQIGFSALSVLILALSKMDIMVMLLERILLAR